MSPRCVGRRSAGCGRGARRVTVTLDGVLTDDWVHCRFQLETTYLGAELVAVGSTEPLAVELERCGPAPDDCEQRRFDTDTSTPTVREGFWTALGPGTHTLTLTDLPAGWTLTQVACPEGSAPVATDLGARRVTVTLGLYQQALCRFTVAPVSGEVIVDNEWGLRRDVGFSHCRPAPAGCSTFSLDDDAESLPAIDPATLPDRAAVDLSQPGIHTITATGVPPGMVVSAIECTGTGATVDLANRRATLVVDGSGDQFSCTFELAGASLGVVMVGTAADVTFVGCGPNPTACSYYVLDDDNTEPHRNRRGEAGLSAGTYVVRLEDLPPSHTLAAIDCTGVGTTVDLPNRRVTIALDAQDVVCTFVVDP